MATLDQRILDLLAYTPGLSDREITASLFGLQSPQQPVNQSCRRLESRGLLSRDRRNGSTIKNYLNSSASLLQPVVEAPQPSSQPSAGLCEDDLKRILETWLRSAGWCVWVAMGRDHGIDIEAFQGAKRWIIEVKGCGSRDAMRVNYFLAILGETLQRMSDPKAKYSIALPDMPQYRKLWQRLPALAKQRTGITALFVNEQGEIEEAFE